MDVSWSLFRPVSFLWKQDIAHKVCRLVQNEYERLKFCFLKRLSPFLPAQSFFFFSLRDFYVLYCFKKQGFYHTTYWWEYAGLFIFFQRELIPVYIHFRCTTFLVCLLTFAAIIYSIYLFNQLFNQVNSRLQKAGAGCE